MRSNLVITCRACRRQRSSSSRRLGEKSTGKGITNSTTRVMRRCFKGECGRPGRSGGRRRWCSTYRTGQSGRVAAAGYPEPAGPFGSGGRGKLRFKLAYGRVCGSTRVHLSCEHHRRRDVGDLRGLCSAIIRRSGSPSRRVGRRFAALDPERGGGRGEFLRRWSRKHRRRILPEPNDSRHFRGLRRPHDCRCRGGRRLR